MVWPLIHHLKSWLWRHRGPLIAGFMLFNLGLLHPLLCVLHCEILLRTDQPRQTGHVHGRMQHTTHHSPADQRLRTAVSHAQPALEHQECQVLPPAVYALILSIPLAIVIVLSILWRPADRVHIRAGQHLRPPTPPPIALLS